MKLVRLAASFVLVSVAAVPAAPSLAQQPGDHVQFSGGAAEKASFKGADAVVYDAAGDPQFKGSQAFVFALAGNPDGRVFEWDVSEERVRISADGSPALWLSCNDLQPMDNACRSRPRPSKPAARRGGMRSSNFGSGEDEGEPQGALPSCPGDPRCPKLK